MKRAHLILLIVLLITFVSCGKRNNDARYIPLNAAMVVHINGKEISEKLPWDEIKENELFKKILSDSTLPESAKAIMNSPDESGLNIKDAMYVYLIKDGNKNLVAGAAHVTDASKIASLLGQIKNSKISQSGDAQIMTNDFGAAMWNKERFLMISEIPDLKNNSLKDFVTDTAVVGKYLKSTGSDLTENIKHLFSLDEKQSLHRERKFTALLNDNGDIHYWVNTLKLMESYATESNLPNMLTGNIEKIYKDNYSTVSVRFDNGQINGRTITYTGDEVTKILRKYSGKPIDEKLVNKLSGNNLAALYFFNFNPEGLKKIIDITGLSGLINIASQMAGFSLDNVVEAFKGDFVFAINDVKKNETGEVDGSMLFAGTIKDKPSFNRVYDGINQLLGLSVGSDAQNKIYQEVLDNYFAIGNRTTAVKNYLATKSSPIPAWEKLKRNPIGGFVDFQYLMNVFQPKQNDSSARKIYDQNINMWDNAYLYGGNFYKGGTSISFEVNVKDKQTNSLRQLNQYLNKMVVWATEKDNFKNVMKDTFKEAPSDTSFSEIEAGTIIQTKP